MGGWGGGLKLHSPPFQLLLANSIANNNNVSKNNNLLVPENFQSPPDDKLHPDVKMDLEYILQNNLDDDIITVYASYVDCIRTLVKEKGVSPEDLRSYLLTLSASSKSLGFLFSLIKSLS